MMNLMNSAHNNLIANIDLANNAYVTRVKDNGKVYFVATKFALQGIKHAAGADYTFAPKGIRNGLPAFVARPR